MRFVKTLHGRGFQARVSERVGMQSSNLSEIVTKDKGTFETTRRAIFEECAKLTPELEGISYESFLKLGELILSKVPGDVALQSLRTLAARENPTLRRVDGRTLRLAHSGVKSTDADQQVANTEPAAMPDRKRLVPLISFVQAGHWATAVDNFHPGDAEEWIACASNVGPRAFALKVSGPSMEPEFRNGDVIVVDPDIEAQSGDYVVAGLNGEEAVFKQYVRDGSRHYLVPLNGAFPTLDMTGLDWRVIGRVMEKIKKY